MEIYTFKFKNRRPIDECSFVNLTMGIIDASKEETDEEINAKALEFWRGTGVGKFETDDIPWGNYVIARKDGDPGEGVALFVLQGLKKSGTAWAIDHSLKYMEKVNGIEPTFADYKRINIEFEEQFKEKPAE